MMRSGLGMGAALGVAMLILGGITIAPAGDGVVQLALTNEVMQCMERCLRSEGKSEKTNCKSRCADISSQRSQGSDCMAVYKQCLKTCDADKTCRRACKKKLMNCY
ncbi:MAG: hypothetical protein CMF67_03535 [Magnetovibrio sp.]|nr:hypothetical protein [Magnetovibrio sp.]|tara:strand:+ start:146 stop:463 length:318 start_codon:yes stop_codon:yes gene_type:complete